MLGRLFKMLAAIALPGAAVLGLCASLLPADEVVLTLGDSYEKVRNRSRAALPPLEKNTNWAGAVSRPARLRFTEPGKSFVTPPAKFLAVTYDARGLVDGVRLSPQLDALPLNETLAIVTDLQDQLRQAWTPFRSKRWQPIQDDVATRNAIRRCDDPTARWNGGSELQLSIDIRCLRTDARPDDERFLITLVLSRPWVDDRE